MNQTYFLQGPKAALRPVEPGDFELLYQWINDPVVTHYMFYGQKPWTSAQVTEEFTKHVLAPDNVVLTVVDAKTGRPVGIAGLYDVHPTARKGEFRVLIGERAAWNKGLGTEVTELLTFYGFDRLNLHRVWLGVTDENKGAVKAYEKAGYALEGRLRDDIYRNSRYYDSVRMGILREDYYRRFHAEHSKRFRAAPAAPQVKVKAG